jgi:hypothetical protein
MYLQKCDKNPWQSDCQLKFVEDYPALNKNGKLVKRAQNNGET